MNWLSPAKRAALVFCSLILAGLCACGAPDIPGARIRAASLAQEHGWQRLDLAAGHFDLTAFVPPSLSANEDGILTVYIEGDGLAWISPYRVSDDPTPLHPVALQLAFLHWDGSAAYLARPCQFRPNLHRDGCAPAYWTDKRYSSEVVEATSDAIDALKARAHARAIQLIGYSGGGTVSALVAARRHDVVRLITVAANLDTTAWLRLQRLSGLSASLNPADFVENLRGIDQIHFVGADDLVVPPDVAYAYVSHFMAGNRPRVIDVPKFDHVCCWVDRWRQLTAPIAHAPVGTYSYH